VTQLECLKVYREYCEANGWVFAPCPMALLAVANAQKDACAKLLGDMSMAMMASDRTSAALVVMDCAAAIRSSE